MSLDINYNTTNPRKVDQILETAVEAAMAATGNIVMVSANTSQGIQDAINSVVGDVQRRLYLSYQTGGFNGIQNSTGTNTFGQGVRSDQGGHALTQKDIKRNVVDNLAPVSPQSSWVDVQADIRNNLKGLLF